MTGFVVSFLLLPSRAHEQALNAAARTLDHLSRALRALLTGLSQGLDTEALHRIQDGIGQSLVRLGNICVEAEQERTARLAIEPALGPLSRTLLRLRHDLVMLGRAAQEPLAPSLRTAFAPLLEKIEAAAANDLSDSATALRARQPPPSLTGIDAALARYNEELGAVRREGITRDLPADSAEDLRTGLRARTNPKKPRRFASLRLRMGGRQNQNRNPTLVLKLPRSVPSPNRSRCAEGS